MNNWSNGQSISLFFSVVLEVRRLLYSASAIIEVFYFLKL